VSRNDITGAEIKTKAATPEFRKGHEAIFGQKRIERGRWIQDPTTGKLVSPAEYARQESKRLHDIFIDRFEPYESPITDEVINNRRKRDYDLKASGSRPYEGFKIEKQEADRYNAYKEKQLSDAMKETVHRTMYEITHGYRRVHE
jgi:hypothetical protein